LIKVLHITRHKTGHFGDVQNTLQHKINTN